MAVQDILSPIQFATEQFDDLSAVTRSFFIEEVPLLARLGRVRGSGETFQVINYDVRTRSLALGANITSDSATTITLGSGQVSALQVGDILRIGAEDVEVTGSINTGANTVAVRRGRGGTTALDNTTGPTSHISGATVTLVGNSRTGKEVDQAAQRAARTTTTQIHQTFQFPVQVGGKAQAITNVALPPGFADMFGLEVAEKYVEMLRDIEYCSYVGKGEAPAADGDRAKMHGLRNIISSTNLTTNPTNKAAYKASDLIRDTVQKVLEGGGNPDFLLVGIGFQAALATWGIPVQMLDAGETAYGTPIRMVYAPFLDRPLMVIPGNQFPANTVFCGTSSDLKMSYLRQESWYPRGRRGDAVEGDWICDFAVKPEHPTWHAWVEGITGYAPQS